MPQLLRIVGSAALNAEKPQPVAKVKPRKKQYERSAATQDKLLEATYRILRDSGHAALRSASISRESGVSRGGLLHHYPTKELLIASVLERIIEGMEEESWKQIDSIEDDVEDDVLLSAIVSDACRRFLDESYRVLLDILIASGERGPVADVWKSWSDGSRGSARDGWAKKLASAGVDATVAEEVTSFLWAMVKGQVARNLVRRDQDLCDRIIALGLDLANSRCAGSRRTSRSNVVARNKTS